MDGRSFSRYTFDPRLSQAMINITKYLLKETGATIGYTQNENEKSKMFFEEIQKAIPELSSKHLPIFQVPSAKSEMFKAATPGLVDLLKTGELYSNEKVVQ